MTMCKKIVHIASFAGNIGDIINHQGFYNSFNINESEVEKIEIRRLYNNYKKNDKLFFNDNLLNIINSSKFLILGGGGFFDVYWDDSFTGTTFNMSKQFIDMIKIPVLVNSMGVHFTEGHLKAKDSFRCFLQNITQRDNWLITLRNDGSIQRVKSVYSNEKFEGISSVPDGGFMINKLFPKIDSLPSNNRRIGMSITNELIEPSFIGEENIDSFNQAIIELIYRLISEGYEICFFLHGPQDLYTLEKILLSKSNNVEKMREGIIIAPYFPYGKEGVSDLIKYYNKCSTIIGMRFHSNVVAIAQRLPSIGLAIHEQVLDLYEELGLSEYSVKIGDLGWADKLYNLIIALSSDSKDETLKEDVIIEKINKEYLQYINMVSTFMKKNAVLL